MRENEQERMRESERREGMRDTEIQTERQRQRQ